MPMSAYVNLPTHPILEELKDVIRSKTLNFESDHYFRTLSAFFLCQLASNMRVQVATPHRGEIPVNMYTCNLGTSGMGKGHSINILEREVFHQFKHTFINQTFNKISSLHMDAAATDAAMKNLSPFEDELQKLEREFHSCGAFPYSFDSGTAPAYKQVRTKAQIGKIGALTFIADEIGTNLLTNAELFAVSLESYDIGLLKQKLIKNTADNVRGEERDDPVPSNLLVFGTPSKLFNGGREEAEFRAMLDSGYARRFFYALGYKGTTRAPAAEEMYDMLTQGNSAADISHLVDLFESMAATRKYGCSIPLPKDVAILNIQYQLDCEAVAAELPEHAEMAKAELSHRYFKALKLAGALAFVDSSPEITMLQMQSAIALAEESGKAFDDIMSRDKPYVRLAKYIGSCSEEITHADIIEDLPFYPTAKNKQEELLNLAISWGYKNNIIVKRVLEGGIEFISGETLQETSLEKLQVSFSSHEAFNYFNQEISFKSLEKLTQSPGIHWVTHALVEGHRNEVNCIPGFNLLIIDCDGGVQMPTAESILENYTFAMYTTKRSTPEKNRFRIILPMKYHLKLDSEDYKAFMQNVFEWLPFEADESVGQRSRKWLSHKGDYISQEGELFDPTPFIPKTKKNLERIDLAKGMKNLSKAEQFFTSQWDTHGRNNTLIRYGLMLRDSGMPFVEVEKSVREFNNRFRNSLTDVEVNSTVMRTLSKPKTAP